MGIHINKRLTHSKRYLEKEGYLTWIRGYKFFGQTDVGLQFQYTATRPNLFRAQNKYQHVTQYYALLPSHKITLTSDIEQIVKTQIYLFKLLFIKLK